MPGAGLLTLAPTSRHGRPNPTCPATSPAWVPPEPVATTTVRAVIPAAVALLGQLSRRVGVAERAGRGRPAPRHGVRSPPLCPQGLRVLQRQRRRAASRVSTTSKSSRAPAARASSTFDRRSRRRRTGEQQVAVQPDDARRPSRRPRRSSSDGLPAATKTSDPSASGRAEQELQGPRLVAGDAEAGQVVTLEEERPGVRARAPAAARAPAGSAGGPVGPEDGSGPCVSGSVARATPGAGDDLVDHPCRHRPPPRSSTPARSCSVARPRRPARRARRCTSRLPGASTSCIAAGRRACPCLWSARRASARTPAGRRDRSRLARIASTSTTSPDSRRRASCSATPVSRHTSGSATHSAFQPRPSRSCPTTMPSVSTCGVGPGQSRQRVQVLAALGIALVRHRDAADGVRAWSARAARRSPAAAARRPRCRSGPGCRRSSPAAPPNSAIRSREVSQEMPGSASPSSAQNSARSSAPCGAKKPRTPTAPPSWPTSHRGTSLGQPLQMASDLVGPGGDLEAEGDRRAGLPVRPSGHHRVAMLDGQGRAACPRSPAGLATPPPRRRA